MNSIKRSLSDDDEYETRGNKKKAPEIDDLSIKPYEPYAIVINGKYRHVSCIELLKKVNRFIEMSEYVETAFSLLLKGVVKYFEKDKFIKYDVYKCPYKTPVTSQIQFHELVLNDDKILPVEEIFRFFSSLNKLEFCNSLTSYPINIEESFVRAFPFYIVVKYVLGEYSFDYDLMYRFVIKHFHIMGVFFNYVYFVPYSETK